MLFIFLNIQIFHQDGANCSHDFLHIDINGKKHFLDYILVCSDKNESENKKGNSKKNHNMKGKNKEFEDGCPDSYDFTMFTSKNRKLV